MSRTNFQTSLRTKLMLMLLVVSICSMLTIAYLSYRSGESNLTERIFNQLTSVRASKAYQIKSYFENIRKQTETLSEDLMVVNAMKDLKAAYRQLEQKTIPNDLNGKLNAYYRREFLPRLAKFNEGSPVLELYKPKTPAARYLQFYYIAANQNAVGQKHILDNPGDGSEYSRVHALYHPIFKRIHERFGYYDIFLIDPDTGAIVYTVFKEVDFATNLFTGPHRTTNLAEAVTAAAEVKGRNYVKIVDFQQYRPSYGAPAAFIAAPIFNQSEFIGILALQLPVDEINRVMTGDKNWRKDGLGDTGETYLVGPDYKMRSVSRFLIEDPKSYAEVLRSSSVDKKEIDKIKQYGTSILLQEVNTEAAKEALAGKEGTQLVEDYRGIPVLSSYAPLQIDGLQWVILSEMDLSEAYAPVYSFQKVVLIWGALIILLITIVAMVLSYIFIKPINTLIANARKIGAGEIDAIVKVRSQDEFGELAEAFNDMVHNLQAQTALIERKNRENEELLLSIFPASVAKRLKNGEQEIADHISNVTILFSDLSGLTKLQQSMSVYETLTTLNDLVTTFDEATEKYGVEKIKTIGNNYMAVCGLSGPRLDHAKRVTDFGLEMRVIVRRLNRERGLNLDIRIGINSGDVIAGIVGRKKFIYDVWGDAVNITSNILTNLSSPPGSILVSQNVYDYLHDLYEFEQVGYIEASEKRKLAIWQLKSTNRQTEQR